LKHFGNFFERNANVMGLCTSVMYARLC